MLLRSLFLGFLLSAVSTVQAGLMITETTPGDPSAGFEAITPGAGDLSSYTLSDGRGDIKFWYGDSDTDTGNGLVQLAQGDERLHDDSWWDSDNHSIFTTGVPSQSSHIWIDLSGVNAYGFAFQIAANSSAHGWFDVHYSGPDSPISRKSISINPNNSPGFQIANSGGSCQKIDKIHVDPSEFIWGVFNMGIDTTGGTCASVPEPGSIALLSIGLLGLGLVRVNQKRRLRARAAYTSN